ncbi:MAG: hypothetical protein JSU77_00795 [Fidelibacterota bacterium]|nr:MAG: hypothetical protein JSU77_00795 [Candidatus Neomarinimicrobiota bacterium]
MIRLSDHSSPYDGSSQTDLPDSWVGPIEAISGGMFSGKTNIHEARRRRCFEPLPVEKFNTDKESRCD